jgi:hypothetical protein
VKTDGGRVARLIEKPDHAACSLVNAGNRYAGNTRSRIP